MTGIRTKQGQGQRQALKRQGEWHNNDRDEKKTRTGANTGPQRDRANDRIMAAIRTTQGQGQRQALKKTGRMT